MPLNVVEFPKGEAEDRSLMQAVDAIRGKGLTDAVVIGINDKGDMFVSGSAGLSFTHVQQVLEAAQECMSRGAGESASG